MSESQEERIQQEQAEAWIGDAVLGLFVRELILREDEYLDGEKFSRFTSNSFLSDLGNPTSVEAEIGRAYHSGGLTEGFHFIEKHLLPRMRAKEKVFQNAERQRSAAKKKKSKRTRWCR